MINVFKLKKKIGFIFGVRYYTNVIDRFEKDD